MVKPDSVMPADLVVKQGFGRFAGKAETAMFCCQKTDLAEKRVVRCCGCCGAAETAVAAFGATGTSVLRVPAQSRCWSLPCPFLSAFSRRPRGFADLTGDQGSSPL